MKSILKNKRAIAPLFLIVIIILILIGVYIFLFLPVPAFKKIRMIINYFLILIFWIVLQVGLIYGYYKLGNLAVRNLGNLKKKILNWNVKIKNMIIGH
jgi:amino acid transporter